MQQISAAYARRVKRVVVCAPTGSGKSWMMGDMLSRTGMETLVLCHRAELLDMICADLTKAGIRHARIEGSRKPLGQIHVGMMQTVARRLDDLPSYRWIISDEVHLAMCTTWLRILNRYPDAFHLGLSATPTRLDGTGLGEFYQEIIQGPSLRELTAIRLLAPCRVYAPPGPEIKVRKTAGDFNMADAAALMDRSTITGDVIGHYRRLAPGRRAIAFCCSVKHAEHVAAQFSAAGIKATFVDGTMDPDQRRTRIAMFRTGAVQVLTNCEILTTGFDDPGVSCGIFLRPTASLALYLQMVGRILRIAPGKEDAVLLDHCSNVISHGMPQADRQWSLDGKPKRESPPAIRQCPACYAVQEPALKCEQCGYVFAAARKNRATPKQKKGDLVEITSTDPLVIGNLRDLLRACRCREDVEAIRAARKYHPRWVDRMMDAYRIGQKRKVA